MGESAHLGEDLLAVLALGSGGVLLVVGALEDLELIRGHGSSDGNEGRDGEDDLHHFGGRDELQEADEVW